MSDAWVWACGFELGFGVWIWVWIRVLELELGIWVQGIWFKFSV